MTAGLVLAAIALAQPAKNPPNRFEASSASAATMTGRLVSLDAKWQVRLIEPDATVPAGELVGLARADRPRPPQPAGPQVILANGDRIPGVLIGGDDLAIRISPSTLQAKPAVEWRVPIAQTRILWVDSPSAQIPADIDRYSWLDTKRKKDTVLLRNGDVQTGDIERFAEDAKSFTWQPVGGKTGTRIELARVAAIAFNPSLVAARKIKGAYARVVLSDGTRVTLTDANADGDRFRGTTAFGAKLDRPLADLVALDVMQGRAVYLSDLKPKRATTEPYGDLSWPWTADRSVKANPLQLVTPRGTETFDKGLGTHPRTTLVYDLAGKYRRFEAWVGLDAATGRRGSAAVAILVDGKKQPVPGLDKLTAASGSVAVAIDVTKAKELTLVIDYGTAGDVQADVNWALARLVE